jgi:hypothetical protein
MEDEPSTPHRGHAYTAEQDEDILTLTKREVLAKHPELTYWGVHRRRKTLRGIKQQRRRADQDTALQRMHDQAGRNLGTITVKAEPGDDDWEAFFDLLENADDLKDLFSPTQDSTEFRAPDDGLPIGVAMTGDWHCGASGVDYRQLRADMDTIARTDGLYAIGMGDYIEGVSTHSKAAPALYSGLINGRRFQEKLALLRAGTAKGKWWAVMDGNHDAWIEKHAGIGTTEDFAKALGGAFFSQGGGTVFVYVGDQKYVVAVRHNAKGNSRLNSTNAHRVTFDSWPEWENCDVIGVGHLHFNDMQVATRKAGRCLYLRSGTYKVVDSYARDNAFVPEYGVPVAIFLPDQHRVVGWRGDDFGHAVEYLGWLRNRYRAGVMYTAGDRVAT